MFKTKNRRDKTIREIKPPSGWAEYYIKILQKAITNPTPYIQSKTLNITVQDDVYEFSIYNEQGQFRVLKTINYMIISNGHFYPVEVKKDITQLLQDVCFESAKIFHNNINMFSFHKITYKNLSTYQIARKAINDPLPLTAKGCKTRKRLFETAMSKYKPDSKCRSDIGKKLRETYMIYIKHCYNPRNRPGKEYLRKKHKKMSK